MYQSRTQFPGQVLYSNSERKKNIQSKKEELTKIVKDYIEMIEKLNQYSKPKSPKSQIKNKSYLNEAEKCFAKNKMKKEQSYFLSLQVVNRRLSEQKSYDDYNKLLYGTEHSLQALNGQLVDFVKKYNKTKSDQNNEDTILGNINKDILSVVNIFHPNVDKRSEKISRKNKSVVKLANHEIYVTNDNIKHINTQPALFSTDI